MNPKPPWLIVLTIALSIAFGVVLPALLMTSCTRVPAEQRLREALVDLQAAIEQHDATALRAGLADDFVGPESLDRDGAERMARLLFLRHRDVGVTLGPVDLQLQPEHATARFTVALTGGSGGMLPDSGQVHDVETGWRLEDGDWRLTSARWTPRL